MKAIIFAAGKGERMRPLTEHTPKPLLTVRGKTLIDYHLEKLSAAGFTDVMINLSYKGDLIKAHCGSGERHNLRIRYSEEGPEPLETGGALNLCMDWFDHEPFAMIAADVYSEIDYSLLAQHLDHLKASAFVAQLILVDNPKHHPQGDFSLDLNTLIAPMDDTYTYSGIAVAKPSLIADFPERKQRFALREALWYWLSQRRLAGSLHTGPWSDVGTPERLNALQGTPPY